MVTKSIKKMLYGALFIIAIPAYLWWLAHHIVLDLPTYQTPLAAAIIAIGLLFILAGFSDLFFKGKGLPMNAFPPKNLVTNGIYAIIPHPIYSGFTLLVAGLSLYYGSATGLWLITPLVLLGCLCLIWGYERPYLLRTFQTLPSPWLGMPNRNSLFWRIGAFLALFIPWLILFEGFKFAGVASDAFDSHLDFEQNISVWIWSYPIYASTYIFVLLPFLFSKIKDLKYFVRIGWLSMLIMSLFYFAVPAIALPRALPQLSGTESALYLLFYQSLQLEIQHAAPFTASFPSYHVVWATLVALIMARISYFWQYTIWTWCGLIIASCFTTGMHSLADLMVGFIIALILFKASLIWHFIIRTCNKMANSYHSKSHGPIRIMSHFKYSLAAGFCLVFLTLLLLGNEYAVIIIGMACVGLLGAVLWGWLIEGSSVSMRPLGYFGSIIGFLAISMILILFGYDLWVIIAVLLCVGGFTQAVGRFRCIVQGCCHGGIINPANSHLGFCVSSERSRVVSLSQLANKNIYPTQLYSIFGNIVLGIILIRLWILQVDIGLIIGLYLVLAGFLRFVEEGYRGEVQTLKYYGLAIYQWLALLFIISGCYIMTITLGSAPAIPKTNLAGIIISLIWATAGGLIGGFVGSIDFPHSNRPFSRLER